MPDIWLNQPDLPIAKKLAEEPTDVILQVQLGPWLGKKIRVPVGKAVTVGRSPRSDVALANDTSISRRHFSLEWDDTACWINDLNSRHGTFLNGKKVQKARLHDGDRIRVGWTVLVVRLQAHDSTPPMSTWEEAAPARDRRTLAKFEPVTAEAERPDLAVQAGNPSPPLKV